MASVNSVKTATAAQQTADTVRTGSTVFVVPAASNLAPNLVATVKATAAIVHLTAMKAFVVVTEHAKAARPLNLALLTVLLAINVERRIAAQAAGVSNQNSAAAVDVLDL